MCLKFNQQQLFQYFEEHGYADSTIAYYRLEVDRISSLIPDAVQDFDEYISKYPEYFGYPASQQRVHIIRRIERFFAEGEMPGKHNPNRICLSSRSRLSCESSALIDRYEGILRELELKDSSIETEIRIVSSFLLFLEGKNGPLHEASRDTVWSYFYDPATGEHLRGDGVSSVIRRFLERLCEDGMEELRPLLSKVPAVKSVHKPYPYLKESELSLIRDLLDSEDCPLTLLDRAIIALLLLLGLRQCDVRALTFDNLLEPESPEGRYRLSIIQQKTGAPLVMELRPAVENPLFDYLAHERPASDDPHLLLVDDKVARPLGKTYINETVDRVFDLAGIRMDGERRGPHLFRHNLTMALIGSGVPIPVTTAMMGHRSSSSLAAYMESDEAMLRECAIDVTDLIAAGRQGGSL